MKKENSLNKILALIGGLVVLAGAVVAIIHFWEEIKARLSCCCKEDELDELEDFVEDGMEDLEDAVEEIEDGMEDFVEFEEL